MQYGSTQLSRRETEQTILTSFEAGDLDGAATTIIQEYGGEILGFLVGRLRSEPDATEAFSQFAEDLWLGLPRFQWRASARTWSYTLARNAACRYQKSPSKRPERNLSLPTSSLFSVAVQEIRSTTKMHLRTEVKNKMRDLRYQLSDDEQTLLVLRIDRNMSWKELARIMSGEGDGMGPADLDRWAARLRQRFAAVKQKLREMAIQEGLL